MSDKKEDRVGEAMAAIARCTPQEIMLVNMMLQTITQLAVADAAGILEGPTTQAAPSKVPTSPPTQAAPSKDGQGEGFGA